MHYQLITLKEINPLINSLIKDSSILENMKHKLEDLSNTYSSNFNS